MGTAFQLFPAAPETSLGNHWLMLTTIAITILTSGYYIHQVYFHPLAKFPGPIVAKFSVIRGVYHAWKGDLHIDIWHCHDKYGPVVRYGPNALLFNTASGHRDIYASGRNIWKHRQISKLNPRAANLITMYNKKEHAKRRRLIGPAFTRRRISQFQDRVKEHINTLISKVSQVGKQANESDAWGPPMDMSEWLRYFTFDAVSDFMFGFNYDLLNSAKHRHIIQDIKDASVRNSVLVYQPLLRVFRADKMIFGKSVRGTRSFWKFIRAAISAQSGINRGDDVFTSLAGANCKSHEGLLSMTEIQSEIGVLVIAGLDTTATAMCALLFYLSKCRQRYEKAANELRDVFNSVAEVRLGSQLESCKYFAACVKESLRISPPIGSSLWREIGEGGETIDGHFIPEGYTVGTGLYSLHHNAAYFHNPHEFIPERWLNSDESDTTGSNTKKSAFNPFSSGPRSCIGESLAYLELLLTIASLLLVYDFRTPERAYDELRADLGTQKPGRGNSEEFQLIDRIFGLSKGPMLQFRPRDILPKKEEANSAKF